MYDLVMDEVLEDADNIKKTIKEKNILDKEHQKIVAELNGTIDRLEKELQEVKNIDQNHQRINGLLHKEVE